MIIAIKAFLLYTLFILVVIISCKVLGLGIISLSYSDVVYQCIEYLILGWVLFLASLFACKIWLF